MDDHHINAVLRAIEDKPDIVLVGGNAVVVWFATTQARQNSLWATS